MDTTADQVLMLIGLIVAGMAVFYGFHRVQQALQRTKGVRKNEEERQILY
ncbi:MAG TPA: hypothetical protein VFV52_18595 [Bacilli bacterium]|nr:hypothetical protein [Bacilli bacterium]